jgi:catechol 2,3-dioxygenase-like lactoylglutathione lyase family enzyme
MKLEVVVLGVSDVDRAKAFYEKLGWRLDAGRTRAADSASRRLLPDFHCGFGQGIQPDQTTVRRGQDFAGRSGRRCTCARRAARQSAAAHRQDLSLDRPAVREHVSTQNRHPVALTPIELVGNAVIAISLRR